MEDHVPTEIGGVRFEVDDRYEVLGLLGQGSFGTVATATDRETGKKLAIKHIHPIAGSHSGARHILREVIIMRALRYHPNVSSQPRRGNRRTAYLEIRSSLSSLHIGD